MWHEIAIILLFICKLNYCVDADNCESLTNCQQCIQAPSCGWYLQYRSANGSGCFKNAYLDAHKTDPDAGYAHPPEPIFLTVKNASEAVISPQEVSLNLRIGEPFSFPVTFTPKRQAWGKRAVEFKHNIDKPEMVNVKFFSKCSGEMIETSKCDNVEFGSSVEFVVKVEQVQCSKRQPERIKKIQIRALPSPAVLRVDLYAFCYCPCEMDDRRANPAPPKVIPDCHNRGNFTCGVCYCNYGFAGKNCEINTTNQPP